MRLIPGDGIVPLLHNQTHGSRRILKESTQCQLLIFALLILGACSRPFGYESLYPIESEIEIKLIEDLAMEGRPAILGLSTGMYAPHREIVAGVNRSGFTFDISIYGLREIDYEQRKLELEEGHLLLIPPSSLEAEARIILGVLEPGKYHLRFRIHDGWISSFSPSDYNLIVTADAYTLPVTSGKWIKFTHSVYRRVPDDVLWGYIFCQSEESIVVANSFLDSLRSIGASPIHLPAGFYGYYLFKDSSWFDFHIDESGQIVYPDIYPIPPFIYHYDSDSLKIKELIEYYVQKYRYYSESTDRWIPYFGVYILTSQGDTFQNNTVSLSN